MCYMCWGDRLSAVQQEVVRLAQDDNLFNASRLLAGGAAVIADHEAGDVHGLEVR